MNIQMKKNTNQHRMIFWGGGALFILIMMGAGSYFFYHQKQTQQKAYREIKVERKDLAVTILATGTVQPENRLEIKPPVAGRVDQVLVKEGQKVFKGQVLAWMSSTERAALLDAAQAQGPEEVKKWEENYKATPILAPLKGTLILKNVESGQTFTNTESVFVMSDRLIVKAQVDETDIASIRLKQEARIVLDAYPQNPIYAHVAQIAFEAKTVNNVTTYDVDVSPNEIPDFMRSGMTANVSFLVKIHKGVLTVPNEAITSENNQNFVTAFNNSKSSQMGTHEDDREPLEKVIEVGITDGKDTEVTSGLSENDLILVPEIKWGKEKPQTPQSPFGMPRMRKSSH